MRWLLVCFILSFSISCNVQEFDDSTQPLVDTADSRVEISDFNVYYYPEQPRVGDDLTVSILLEGELTEEFFAQHYKPHEVSAPSVQLVKPTGEAPLSEGLIVSGLCSELPCRDDYSFIDEHSFEFPMSSFSDDPAISSPGVYVLVIRVPGFAEHNISFEVPADN